MAKKLLCAALCAVLLFTGGCKSGGTGDIGGSVNSVDTGDMGKAESTYQRYQADFYEIFDTYTMVIGYTQTEREFQQYFDIIQNEMLRLHQLYDIYNNYNGVNNMKTINDNAGVAPVKVDESILDLLELGQQSYQDTDGVINVAMGSVLHLWHNYRMAGLDDPSTARVPPMEELVEANQHTNIADMILDREAGTVYLRDPQMSLDVGALGKGYAVQRAIEKAEEAGLQSGILSSGGDVSVLGQPMDERDAWSVGIQQPVFTADGSQPLFDSVFLTDSAVVSSGDYQRFYVVDGKNYHHIIDPETLMPADEFVSVTVIHEDSGIADMLSTAVFIMSFEDGAELIANYGAEALWIHPDYSAMATQGYMAMSNTYSGSQE